MFLQYLLQTSITTNSLKSNRSLLDRALFTGAVLVAFVNLQAPAAVAGTGTFRDGKFNFCVSIRFNASPTEMQRIKDVLEVANQVLYDATDGQHRFGTISLINNSGASDQADVWIHFGGGRGDAGGLLAYGIRGRHINLYNAGFFQQPDTMHDALKIVHEFAHFTYGVDDEYRGPFTATGGEPFAACPGDDRNSPTLNYCIMDNFSAGARRLTTTYSVNEFCVHSNHDKPLTGATPDQANDTAQSATNHGDSCWETMSKIERKWRLNAPANLPQDTPPSTPPPPVVFTTSCEGQSQRVVLLFDRSGSMVTEERLAWAKKGAAILSNCMVKVISWGLCRFPLVPPSIFR